MPDTSFAVSRFTNRSGVTSWRISGWIAGVRVRRNFPTREEAAAEKPALELKSAQAAAGMRTTVTFLSDAQLRQAEDAFRRLEGRPESLLGYLELGLAAYRPPECQKALDEAASAYLAKKTVEHERTLLSARQLISIRFELRHLVNRFPGQRVSQLTPALLTPYLERGHPCLKTYNNRRGLISTFFKFAFDQDWIAANPVEKTPHHRINHRRGSAVTLSADQSAELMAFVEDFEGGELVPSFAISLFAGIRPCVRYGEIAKLRPKSVKLETGVIHVEPEVSKVRMKRLVAIQPNLAAWLLAYPLDRLAIVLPNATNTRPVVFAKFGLTHDVLRHTFISMFVAKFRSMGEAALQAGNSESIIRKHYLDLKSPAEAEKFFGILPKRSFTPLSRFPDQTEPAPQLRTS